MGERDTDIVLKKNCLTENDIKNKRVLLAGTGSGGDLIWLLKMKPALVVAIDYSQFIRKVAAKFTNENVHFAVADVCDLAFKKGAFDLVVSRGIIQHSRSPELAFFENCRVLTKGGLLSAAYAH